MEERNAFDVLQDYPKELGLEYDVTDSDRRFYIIPNDPLLNRKYVAFRKNEILYFAYDSYAAKNFMSQTFTGVYLISNLDSKFECEIRKRDWLDIFSTNKKKTGNIQVDAKLSFVSKSDMYSNAWLTEEVAYLFLQLESKIRPIKIIVKDDYLPLISAFKGHSIMGIETNKWVYKKDEVDAFISIGAQILKKLNIPRK